ncbi:MAG: DJ-1/PfpI family protein [Lachnospiraceae bacterium]|nr:DJ-1/PfpI family protein [Lachnospiraceae bacterium]
MKTKKILCYIYNNMADFEISVLLHFLKNIGGYEITAIADDSGVVTAQSGLHCIPDKKIDEIGDLSGYDGLIIPGGPINNNQNEICSVIQRLVFGNKLVAAICFAPQFLGRTGVLNEYTYTTSCTEETIRSLGVEDPFPREGYRDERVVVDRNVITARGHAFVDFAEAVCEYLGVFESEEMRKAHFGKMRG